MRDGALMRNNALMRRIGIALAIGVLAAAPAAMPAPASGGSEVMATVRQFTEVFSLSDPRKALAACADEALIIDDFPPHVWQGSNACSQWFKDFEAFVKQNSITDSSATLLKAWHVDITADRAYVVVPINFKYKMGGKDVKETGSVLTVALRQGPNGWRITAWAVAAH